MFLWSSDLDKVDCSSLCSPDGYADEEDEEEDEGPNRFIMGVKEEEPRLTVLQLCSEEEFKEDCEADP